MNNSTFNSPAAPGQGYATGIDEPDWVSSAAEIELTRNVSTFLHALVATISCTQGLAQPKKVALVSTLEIAYPKRLPTAVIISEYFLDPISP